MTDWSALVTVGRIVRPHGIRGQVVIAPETDFGLSRFKVGVELIGLVDGRPQPLRVSASREREGRWIVGFDGVTTMSAAEQLRDTELRVAADRLHALSAGQFYLHDLAGCDVVTTLGEAVGQVDRVELGTGTPVLVVIGKRGEVLVPLAEPICQRVDVAAKRIEIDPPEGLIDLNAPAKRGNRKRA